MTEVHRKTKETDVHVSLDMYSIEPSELNSGLPFLDHMLHAMSFHGAFHLKVNGKGDILVDPHHLVEDIGLVMGDALHRFRTEIGGIKRYGHSLIPMDDALSEAVVDVCGRPYLVLNAHWPQTHAGNFDLSLLREFWWGLAVASKMNIHLNVRYAENAHHAAEALFKAVGRALSMAYQPIIGDESAMSTKGSI